MTFMVWAVILMVLASWFLGYKYIQMHGDIRAKEHKILLKEDRLKHLVESMEEEKGQLEQEIQELENELSKLRQES